MKELTNFVKEGGQLDENHIVTVVENLLSSGITDEVKVDFLEALNRRGESAKELFMFAKEFLGHSVRFEVPAGIGNTLDVCGTGGDRIGLFNISTAVMFVAAGAGAKLVKHGNRGISSQSGGADVLEALDVPIDSPDDILYAMLEEAGAVFLFAPRFHPAFKSVATARKLLAWRGGSSVFNMLGPLLNPAQPSHQLVGVFSKKLLELYSEVLPAMGRERAWVVLGSAGGSTVMDEISTLGRTHIAEISAGHARHREVHPGDLGVRTSDIESLRGGDAECNARILEDILSGTRRDAARDIVLVNAAAALQVAGIATDWNEAMGRAGESIDSGNAKNVLLTLRRLGAKA